MQREARSHRNLLNRQQSREGEPGCRDAGDSAQYTYGVEVSWPGLKHQGTTSRSSRLKVEYHSHVFRPWMFAHKSRCTKQVRFFAVGEQHDYVVRNRASSPQGPNGLENGGDAGA